MSGKRKEKDLNAVEVGRRIALARREQGGMTQRELADLVGVTERSLAEWELGGVLPYRWIRRLEEVLDRPASWILYGDEAVPVDLQQQLTEIRAKLDEVLKRVDGGRPKR
jgi:transcriptional regulator with XRE-family HTH domain